MFSSSRPVKGRVVLKEDIPAYIYGSWFSIPALVFFYFLRLNSSTLKFGAYMVPKMAESSEPIMVKLLDSRDDGAMISELISYRRLCPSELRLFWLCKVVPEPTL